MHTREPTASQRRPGNPVGTRVLILLLIMVVVALGVGSIALASLYNTAIVQQTERLVETTQSRARLMGAMARFDARYSTEDIPGGSFAATLQQIRDAHEQFAGFGETGDFAVARREGEEIVFLLRHRYDADLSPPVTFLSDLAEPMRRALSGESGSLVGLHYRGERVLAAYEPVRELDLGLVATIDMAEVRAPFIRAGLLVALGAVVLISIGGALFRKIGEPLIHRLAHSERELRDLYDNAPDMFASVDPATATIVRCNQRLTTALGYTEEELVGRSVFDLYHPDGVEDARRVFEAFRTTGEIKNAELLFRCKDGREIAVSLNVTAVRDEQGKIIYSRSAARDITERKRAEEERERLLHEMGERVKELGCMYGVAESIRTRPDLPDVFRDVVRLIPPGWQYPERTAARIRFEGAEYATEPFDETRWRLTSNIVVAGGPCGVVEVYYLEEYPNRDEGPFLKEERHLIDGIAKSLSQAIERKQAEEALQASRRRLRNLASRLHAVGEEERTIVAHEMHDELGQALTAMRMDLDWLSTRIHKHEKALYERAGSIMSLVDSTFDTVRGISWRLRPPILDDLGLEAAVEWYAEDFGNQSHLDVQFDSNIAEVALDTAVVTAVFRILQEALTNVARHAGASHVKVTLGVRDGRLVMEVIDDGKGITDGDTDSADALGLIGMRERAGSFGGRVSFRSPEEGGTEVKLTVPLRAEEGWRGSMIRLMIADGYSGVRQDLRRIVEQCSDMKVVGEAVDAHNLFTKLDTIEADVLLLDVAMPGMEFMDIMEQLRARPRQFAVLVLSVRLEDQYAERALRAEASGYLSKDHWPTDLAKAIRHVNRGGRYVTPTLAEKPALESDPTTVKPLHESLSDREYQVLCMLASGKSVKEIGAELDVSPKTVSTYRTRILEKMKLKTTADLIRYAVERHLEL